MEPNHVRESKTETRKEFPEEAYEFLRVGLDRTVQQIHGPIADASLLVYQWLHDSKKDLADLSELAAAGELPPAIIEALDPLGGPDRAAEKLNRHVTGRDLCHGLRDLALGRWGLMASTVLRRWGIVSTMDFGRMVFNLIERERLQKQPSDRIEDFANVFEFDSGFDRAYRIGAAVRARDVADDQA